MKFTGFPENVEMNPLEIDGFAFVKDFRTPKSGVSLNKKELILAREDFKRLEKWRKEEYGRFQNPPLKITTNTITNNVPQTFEFNFYFDLKTLKRSRNKVTCGIEARKSEKHFFDNANYLLFDLINEMAGLDASLAVDVPYIIIPDLLEIQRAIAIVTELTLLYQLYMLILQIAQIIASFSDPTFLFASILQLAALLTFTFFTAVALFQASVQLKELYFPTVRNFKAFSDLDLIRSGIEYLGYVFESDVMNNELNEIYTCGRPSAIQGKSITQFFQNEQTSYFNEGFPTDQDTTPTLWSLIEWYLKQFNLRIFVFEGVVKMERRLSFINAANVEIVPTLTNQADSEDDFIFNEGDAWGRAYDRWAVDFSDIHSPDTYDGMKSEHITIPLSGNIYADDLVNLTGKKEDSAPFALAGRKDGFTKLEIVVEELLTSANAVLSALGSNTLTNNVGERDGVMIIENQYFEITKKLTGKPVNGVLKQPSDYKDKLSMDFIYDNFKKDLEVDVNSFIVKEFEVPFTDENFISLLQNNYVIDKPSGEIIEVKHATWFDRQKRAKLLVLYPDDSLVNTETIKLA